MKKIMLDLDGLAVNSFPTTREPVPAPGTILGHEGPGPDPISLPPTEDASCNPQSQYCESNTCPVSCYGSCYDASCVSCAITCWDPIGPAPTP